MGYREMNYMSLKGLERAQRGGLYQAFRHRTVDGGSFFPANLRPPTNSINYINALRTFLRERLSHGKSEKKKDPSLILLFSFSPAERAVAVC